jgi:hypothetical protein
MKSAGVTLVKGDLGGIVRARALSTHVMRNIRQNLFFALIYNALGVPIAAQHTFGNDVLKCPCGGRRTIRALFSTHKAAEERLTALGRHLATRLLPRSTAGPQLTLAV